MLEEEPDAAAAFGTRVEDIQRSEDEEWPPWSDYIRNAWGELRDDRHIGAMGGMGRIYFSAIHQYAVRSEISGSDFDDFLMFLRALDDEFMRHVAEKQKADKKAKS